MQFDDSKLIRKHADYLELLIYHNNNAYPIEYCRMNTPQKVIGWIFHLIKKGNVTKEHLRVFIEAAKEIGVDVDLHC